MCAAALPPIQGSPIQQQSITASNQVDKVAQICDINPKDLQSCQTEHEKWGLIERALTKVPPESALFEKIASTMGFDNEFIKQSDESVEDLVKHAVELRGTMTPRPAYRDNTVSKAALIFKGVIVS